MARITAFVLSAVFAGMWAAGAAAESSSKTNSSSPAPKTTTSSAPTPSAPRPAAPAAPTPAQKINNIVNYGAVKTNQNPGPVNRVTPTGTQPMTPNAAQANRGLHTNAVPAPKNPNARGNTQGRNVNPTGDKAIAAGYDRNQQRYQANQPKPKPVTTPTASTARSWPGPARPATTPAIRPSTTTVSASARPAATTVARPASPPPPPPARSSYTAASSSSTAKSTSSKK